MLLSTNKVIYSLLFIFFINFFFQFFGPLLYFENITFGLNDIQDYIKKFFFILDESYYLRLVSLLIIWIAAFILPIFLVFFFF